MSTKPHHNQDNETYQYRKLATHETDERWFWVTLITLTVIGILAMYIACSIASKSPITLP